ncbi:MAG: ATP-dependent Clp protease adaptor ClpS [Flavobacteriales bacterium]|nr:ATP-dependent Clp protease adaptor ClpS [Flavobacteriales bacterium]
MNRSNFHNSGWKYQEEDEILLDVLGGYAIILYNDDVNTFDHVIDCLVKYCEHDPLQAEQCSLIVHYKGKCAVMHGGNRELVPVCEALCGQGLSAVIEEA